MKLLRLLAELLYPEESQDTEDNRRDGVVQGMLNRERQGNTALDDAGVAVPHCRLAGEQYSRGCVVLLQSPILFPDEKVDIFFGLVVPANPSEAQAHEHLEILSGFSRAIINPSNRSIMRKCSSAESLHRCFQQAMRT